MKATAQEQRDLRGAAAEYHVNNTLYRSLGAGRWKKDGSQQDFVLFDGILLPSPAEHRYNQPFTEVDHLLVSTKGVFAIETKSISGKVFGEKKSKKWHSAIANARYEQGLYDRGFTNPFKQNAYHIMAISKVLKDAGIQAWINNLVILVDADVYGWEPGHWGSEVANGLFLSANQAASYIQKQNDSLSLSDVQRIAKALNSYYLSTETNMATFRRNLPEAQA